MRKPKAPYFSPSENTDIASGDTETLEFGGRHGREFAFNRILFGCSDPSKLHLLEAELQIGSRDVIIPKVQLLALNRLFYDRSLEGAFQIDSNRTLQIEITNNHNSSLNVGASLNGYDGNQLENKKQEYQSRGRTIPEPVFLYGSKSIPANATLSKVGIELPKYDVVFNRMAVSSGSDDNLKMLLRYDNTDIMPERYVKQVNNEFQSMPVVTPFSLKNHKNLNARVTNQDGGNAHDISIIVESYKAD